LTALHDASQLCPQRLLEGDFLADRIGCLYVAVAHRRVERRPVRLIARVRACAAFYEGNRRVGVSPGGGMVQRSPAVIGRHVYVRAFPEQGDNHPGLSLPRRAQQIPLKAHRHPLPVPVILVLGADVQGWRSVS